MKENRTCCKTGHTDVASLVDCRIAFMKEITESIARLEAKFSESLLELLEISHDPTSMLGSKPDTAPKVTFAGEDDMRLRGILMSLSREVNISDRALQTKLGNASLLKDLPVTNALFKGGKISVRAAEMIAVQGIEILNIPPCETCPNEFGSNNFGCKCGAEAATKTQAAENLTLYDRELARVALKPGMNAWAVKKRATQIAATLQQVSLEEQQKTNLEELQSEGVQQIEICDGLIENRFVTTAVVAKSLKSRLKQIARLKKQEIQKEKTRANAADEVPTIGQLEIETLLEIINGKLDEQYDTVRGQIGLTLSINDLIGRPPENPVVTLEGYGPVAYDNTVKNFIANAKTWARIFINPKTGRVAHTDSYEPTAQQRQFLKYRDQTCRWAGCGVVVSTPEASNGVKRADIDHTKPWAEGGTTDIDNLAHLCRRHHVAKHNTGWQLKNLGDGVLEWVSPTGKKYIDNPASYTKVQFKPVTVQEERPPPF